MGRSIMITRFGLNVKQLCDQSCLGFICDPDGRWSVNPDGFSILNYVSNLNIAILLSDFSVLTFQFIVFFY